MSATGDEAVKLSQLKKALAKEDKYFYQEKKYFEEATINNTLKLLTHIMLNIRSGVNINNLCASAFIKLNNINDFLDSVVVIPTIYNFTSRVTTDNIEVDIYTIYANSNTDTTIKNFDLYINVFEI